MFNIFNRFMKQDYKFNEPENTACITCDHVVVHKKPILYVAHDEDDGCWQFLCGQENHTEANAKIIPLKNATKIDDSLNQLSELPLGCGAERESINDNWIPFKMIREE